jgi:predicted phage tail protein
MNLPKNLDANARAAVQSAISEAFLSGFRLVLFSCAGLSIASAAVAQILIPQKGQPSAAQVSRKERHNI